MKCLLRLCKGFLRLATVAKAFLYPVRRALYEDLLVEGGERFLMMASQLRFCPHLAHFVRRAHLTSTCKQRTYIDGQVYGSRDPTPFLVSDRPLVWFLDACPRLSELYVSGPDFLPALGSRPVAQCGGARRVTHVELMWCDHDDCNAHLKPGWLVPIMQLPALDELMLWAVQLGRADNDPLRGLQPGTSSCSNITVCTITQRVPPQSLLALVKASRQLRELDLEMPALPRGALKRILLSAARTLRTLVVSDHVAKGPDAWELDVVSQLPQLDVLAINDVPVRHTLFDHLPPRLRHLKLSCLDSLPAPVLIEWLRNGFHQSSLRILQTSGMLKRTMESKVEDRDRATPEQLERIRSLCAQRGIEWRHDEGWLGFDEDEEEEEGGDFFMPHASEPMLYF